MNAQFEQCLKDGESLLKFGRELQQHIENEDLAIQQLRETTTKMKENLGKENLNLEITIESKMVCRAATLGGDVLCGKQQGAESQPGPGGKT